ncbi:MAG: NUDIX hydrolase [Anaerolineae bacterium]|nr:NUDIX hydrolase [Anaerolineae bacterium]
MAEEVVEPIRDVAAAVIQRADGRVLLVQRGATAPTFPNCWGVITGFVEPGEPPAQTALREIAEELGISARVVREGAPFEVDIGPFIVRAWPFLCAINPGDAIQLHAENQRYEWVALSDVFARPTIPQLEQDFRALGLL